MNARIVLGIILSVSSKIFCQNVTFFPLGVTLYPPYAPIASCQCDLTENLCDINCCCDQECTVDEVTTFQCFQGFFGGNFTTDDVNLCGSLQFMKPDHHQFTCIQFLNSPLIGLFYTNFTGVLGSFLDDAAFQSVLSLKNDPTFGFETPPLVDPTPAGPNYTNSDPIQAIVRGNLTFITLPQRSLNGGCIRNSLIGYQVDSDADCDVTVTNSLCTSGSVLDSSVYWNNELTIAIMPNNANQNITPTVEFLCSEASNFVKTNTRVSPTNSESLFSGGTPPSAGVTCTSSAPIISGSNCNNSVVGVTYAITWSGGIVTSMNVIVTLADVPMTSPNPGGVPDNVLTQSFRVRFQSEGTPTQFRSGSPGYNAGFPIISGDSVLGAVVTVNSLSIWQPGPSGLCSDSISVAPPYGQDILSGCLLRLSLTNMLSCADLRNEVETQQMRLVTATLVARFGNPNFTEVEADWLTVVRNFSNSTSVNETFGQCSQIPAHVIIEFMTSQTGVLEGFPIMEVVGARVSWSRETWSMSCLVNGACRDNATVQSFAVTSSVIFTEVEAVPGPAPTLFQTRDNKTCARDVTCWEELLLPLSARYYVTMPSEMARMDAEANLIWALFIVFVSTGAVFLTFDWVKLGRYVKQTFPL